MYFDIRNIVHDAGKSLSSNLYNASIQKSLGVFDIQKFSKDQQPYIYAYIRNEIDSITALYLYMKSKEI